MTSTSLDKHFLAIWRRALNQGNLDSLTPELISSWVVDRGLSVENVEERDVGPFGKTKCIVLTVQGARACYPKIYPANDPVWKERNEKAGIKAKLWEKVEWFLPFWVPMGRISELLKDVEYSPKEQAIELFNYHTSTMYTLPFQAVCIAQIIPQANSLRDFSSLVREAYLAFYSGYRASSIAALIPAIEGSLTRIISNTHSQLSLPDKIDQIVDRAINFASRLHFEQMWTPREYLTNDYLFGQDERVFAFETFRRWLRKSFFCGTDEYNGVTWLNRHLFAHATSSSWQQSANFTRLIVALATLGVVESWHDEANRVSLFFPEMNDDSNLLWQQALLRAKVQMEVNLFEEKTYHEHGRLVPDMPTDNGVLLRKAILSEDCINDLVRPLRDAGWSVEVKEPDESALYMTVVASSGNERLSVALLYSCATSNEIYRKLAESSAVILYRGAPYHQDQYAYGLKVHVGPVTGWQPPLAPT